MNIPKKVFLTLCALMVIATCTPLQAATPEESFRKSFPNIPLESITPTDIPGLYEIVAGGRIIYYAPGPEYLIVGEILTKERKNLTQARNNELLAKKFKDLPLEKAMKIGSGPHTVIEITDPDCPFCRKASSLFRDEKRCDAVCLLLSDRPAPSESRAKGPLRSLRQRPGQGV